MNALKPIYCVVLNAGIAPYSFKSLKMVGMYLPLMENVTV